jgi:protein SCO1
MLARSMLIAAGVSLALLMPPLAIEAHEGHGAAAGPTARYAFPLAAPGSYRLPPLRAAAGGSMLDETGTEVDLGEMLHGRITVLSFIYTRCADLCPLATSQLAHLQDLAADDAALDAKVRLVSISFDPEHDTPAVMAEYADTWSRSDNRPEWRFVTTGSKEALSPILKNYDQAIDRTPDHSDPTGGLNHILRAFLIDADGRIRNIYSLDFLDPELILNDIRTLLLE